MHTCNPTQWCRDQGESCWMCVNRATVKQLGLLCVLTLQDDIFVPRYLWWCQQLWAESSAGGKCYKARVVSVWGLPGELTYVSYCWPKCSDLVSSWEDDLIPLHYKAMVPMSSWEPGCYSLVIVSFNIEVSEGHFLPIVGGVYIRLPLAYRSPHPATT